MLELIDVNCRIGRGPVRREGAPEDTAAVLSLMDDFRVSRALVYHSVAKYSDPQLGNSLLLEEIGQNDRFLPQWAVLPALWELRPAPAQLAREMKEKKVRSVRLFPAQYGHSLRRYAAGALLDMLAERRIPAFIDLDQLSSWDALYDLCRTYPDNVFVLCSPGYRCLRYLVPVMEHCDNLYVETSNFLTHNGLREFCRHMGADRLLFGSGVPDASLAAAASQLTLSDLSDAEKQMIAAGNVLRLLGEVSV